MEGNIYTDIWNVEDKTLSVQDGLDFVAGSGNGAENIFVGTVRDNNQGRKVIGISYDVFEPLAKQSFIDICREAQNSWGKSLNLYVVHAKGRLNIGGISIVIAVGSPHRDESFKACRYIIEQIKHRSPIWKLEHYIDGDSEWTKGCELCDGVYKAEQ